MPKHCAPGKGDSVSCFTQSSLEKIANHWNQQNQDNLISVSKNKKILWKRLKEKFRTISKCPNEWCWIDTELLKNIKDPEILRNTFSTKNAIALEKRY